MKKCPTIIALKELQRQKNLSGVIIVELCRRSSGGFGQRSGTNEMDPGASASAIFIPDDAPDCASYVGGPLSSTIQLPSSAAAAIPEIEDMLLYLLLPKKILKFLGFELWDRMSPTCISVPVPRKNLHF